MKTLKAMSLLVILSLACATAYPQTKDLGLGAFENDQSPILMAVDAGLISRQPDNPYLMLVLYLASKDPGPSITVDRNDIVMVANGQEYHMPSVEELRKNYQGEIRDIGFYRRLGKEGIVSSWIRLYKFQTKSDFFPPLTRRAPLAVNEGSMAGPIGFMSKCYFKNPGLAKGDSFLIRVHDKKNPDLTGEITVTIK